MKKDSLWNSRHLNEADEGYIEHLLYTLKTGLKLILSGLIVIIHGLIPFILVHQASCMIEDIHTSLQLRKEACDRNKKLT